MKKGLADLHTGIKSGRSAYFIGGPHIRYRQFIIFFSLFPYLVFGDEDTNVIKSDRIRLKRNIPF